MKMESLAAHKQVSLIFQWEELKHGGLQHPARALGVYECLYGDAISHFNISLFQR